MNDNLPEEYLDESLRYYNTGNRVKETAKNIF